MTDSDIVREIQKLIDLIESLVRLTKAHSDLRAKERKDDAEKEDRTTGNTEGVFLRAPKDTE
jgi:hypothetical protein